MQKSVQKLPFSFLGGKRKREREMATEQPAKAPVTTEIEPAGPNKTDEKPSTPEVEYDSRRSKFLLAIDRADVIEIAEQLCLGGHVDCVQTLTGNRYVLHAHEYF